MPGRMCRGTVLLRLHSGIPAQEVRDGFCKILCPETLQDHGISMGLDQVGGQGMDARIPRKGEVLLQGKVGTFVPVMLQEQVFIDSLLTDNVQDFLKMRGGQTVRNKPGKKSLRFQI